jgi:hypothetical protein
MQLFVVHIEENYIGEVCVPAKTETEARKRVYQVMQEYDSSVFNLDSTGYQIFDVNETSKTEAEANNWTIVED